MADEENLGSRLRKARDRMGKSQNEICELAGIPKVQTLSSYERGVNSPPLDALKRLSEIYEVSTDYLLFGEEYAARTAKNDKYYLSQLVYAADKLHLPVRPLNDKQDMPWDNRPCSIVLGDQIPLDSEASSIVGSFIDKWIRLRNAKASGAIDWDDYDSIIAKRLDEVPDDIEFLSSIGELPF